MNVNANVRSQLVPTSHMPRTRYDMGVSRVLTSQAHGRLTPFFCEFVYPNETWQMDMTCLVQADVFDVTPLDHIYNDIYFFYVPIRIIDPNFKKVLGDTDPYDDTDYSFPQIGISTFGEDLYHYENTLLCHLGYNLAQIDSIKGMNESSEATHPAWLCAYPIMAFWDVYNEFFRSEILDASVDLSSVIGEINDISLDGDIPDQFLCPLVNKYHDYFTNAFTSPMRGQEPTINMNQVAPVIGGGDDKNYLFYSAGAASIDGDDIAIYAANDEGQMYIASNLSGDHKILSNMVVDLRAAGLTINNLRLAWQLTALYERKQIYGTRYTEYLESMYGSKMPDSMLDRPEYLGGSRETLSQLGVLNQANNLGAQSGFSKTTLKGCSWTKSFGEFGIVLGLSATRVRHIYSQGINPMLWDIKTELDLYNPLFASIGMQPIKNKEIYNHPAGGKDDEVFGYTEAWSRLRTIPDRTAGIFSPCADNSDGSYLTFVKKWTFQDIYSSLPVLSDSWLKEDSNNVRRTLSGRTIPFAPTAEASDLAATPTYLMGYYLHPIVTRPLPAYSIPVELTGSF